MNKEKIYPVGTIVLVNNATIPAMIAGISKEDGIIKYTMVPYPYGLFGDALTWKISLKDINKVYFQGYYGKEEVLLEKGMS